MALRVFLRDAGLPLRALLRPVAAAPAAAAGPRGACAPAEAGPAPPVRGLPTGRVVGRRTERRATIPAA